MMLFKYDGKTAHVESLEEARAVWVDYRDKTGKGVSEIGNGGVVIRLHEPPVKISYNGKMWLKTGIQP